MSFSLTSRGFMLQGTVLTAECLDRRNDTYSWSDLCLDDILDNNDGRFTLQGHGFSKTAEKIHLRGTFLVATMRTRDGSWTTDEIDLNQIIQNKDGALAVFRPVVASNSAVIVEIEDWKSQTDYYRKKRNFIAAHDAIIKAQMLWAPEMSTQKPELSKDDLQEIVVGKIEQLKAQAEEHRQIGQFIAACDSLSKSQALWVSGMPIGKPEFMNSVSQGVVLGGVREWEGRAETYRNHGDFARALDAMKEAQKLWKPELPIAKPEFTTSKYQEIVVGEIERLKSKAENHRRALEFKTARDAMAKAQEIWKPDLSIEKPQFTDCDARDMVARAIETWEAEAKSDPKTNIIGAYDAIAKAQKLSMEQIWLKLMDVSWNSAVVVNHKQELEEVKNVMSRAKHLRVKGELAAAFCAISVANELTSRLDGLIREPYEYLERRVIPASKSRQQMAEIMVMVRSMMRAQELWQEDSNSDLEAIRAELIEYHESQVKSSREHKEFAAARRALGMAHYLKTPNSSYSNLRPSEPELREVIIEEVQHWVAEAKRYRDEGEIEGSLLAFTRAQELWTPALGIDKPELPGTLQEMKMEAIQSILSPLQRGRYGRQVSTIFVLTALFKIQGFCTPDFQMPESLGRDIERIKRDNLRSLQYQLSRAERDDSVHIETTLEMLQKLGTPNLRLNEPGFSDEELRKKKIEKIKCLRALANSYYWKGSFQIGHDILKNAQELWTPSLPIDNPEFIQDDLQTTRVQEIKSLVFQADTLQEMARVLPRDGYPYKVKLDSDLNWKFQSVGRGPNQNARLEWTLRVEISEAAKANIRKLRFQHLQDLAKARHAIAKAQKLWAPNLQIDYPQFSSDITKIEMKGLAGEAKYRGEIRELGGALYSMMKAHTLWTKVQGPEKPRYSAHEYPDESLDAATAWTSDYTFDYAKARAYEAEQERLRKEAEEREFVKNMKPTDDWAKKFNTPWTWKDFIP